MHPRHDDGQCGGDGPMITLVLPQECCVWTGYVPPDQPGTTLSIPVPSDAFVEWAVTNGVDLSTLFMEQRPVQSRGASAPSHAFATAYDVIGNFQSERDATLVMLIWGATMLDES
jgi:hypothetical protein